MLDEDKPLFLVGCPKCGPSSTWQNVRFEETSEEDRRRELTEALIHLRFTIQLCIKQVRAGCMFLLEHPVGAASWATEAMAVLAQQHGVHSINFDFCMMGMQSHDEDGAKGPARKRTRILTNSQRVAQILRGSQCTGAHRHITLEGGESQGV